jgi:hypothetical protein
VLFFGEGFTLAFPFVIVGVAIGLVLPDHPPSSFLVFVHLISPQFRVLARIPAPTQSVVLVLPAASIQCKVFPF